MDEYDIYLNGKGYMLAKDETGQLLAGTVQQQESDPFTRFVSESERWKVASMTFGEGAGALKYDGTRRYGIAENVDSRSGDLLRGPLPTATGKRALVEARNHRHGSRDAVNNYAVSTTGGDFDGVALKFTTSHTEIRSVSLLVKRRDDEDYAGVNTFQVEIRADAAGVPGAAAVALGQVNVSPIATEYPWLPYENLWTGHEYFWLEVTFSGIVTVVSGNPYWLCLINGANAEAVDWAASEGLTATISTWNGAAWAAATTDWEPYNVIRYADDLDASTRAFATFRGIDTQRRLYAAVGAKVMYWDNPTSAWLASKDDFPQVVHDLLDYDGDLYAACGSGTNMWYFDGTSPTGTWTAVTVGVGQEAQCFALHDNLIWKADIASVKGSVDGHGVGTWGGNAVEVGDARTPVSKMISHGGKLYCAKPEGIYEVTYPDGYPGGGTPTVNLVHDFRNDRVGRNFIVDWHSGCYFPGAGGVYQWMSGILQDVWRSRFTQDADRTPLLPGYIDRKGYFRAAGGSTRGLFLGSHSAYTGVDGQDEGGSHIWLFDGTYFYPLMHNSYVAEPIYAIFLEDRGEGFGRLWWGLGPEIFYTDWPTWTDDRTGESRCTFHKSANGFDPGKVVLPIVDDKKPELLKDWYSVTIRSNNLGTGATEGGTVTILYDIDDAGLTTLGIFDTSPVETLYLPADTTGYKIYLEAWLNDQVSSDYTWRIDAIELRYQPLPDTITQFHVAIRAADQQQLHGGGQDQRSAAQIAADLSALLEESEPITYRDDLGNSHSVRVNGQTRQGTKIEERPSGQGKGFRPEATIMVSMLKIGTVRVIRP